MIQIDLSAQPRRSFGKGEAGRLRREGFTPAVLYGPKTDPITLQLDTKSFLAALRKIQKRNAIINIDIEGMDTRHVIIKDIQTDPVRGALEHSDFYEISMDSPISLSVPLQFTGKAKGIDLGGELMINNDRVTLRGMILDFPDFIELDVTELSIGDNLKVSDLTIPDNLTLLDNEDDVCVSVHTASVAALAEEEEAESGEGPAAEESAEAEPAEA